MTEHTPEISFTGNLKDLPYMRALEKDPTLLESIQSTCHQLQNSNIPMPVVHITTEVIKHPDGSETATGYVDNIRQQGFRPRDTNVAAFVERGNSVRIGQPEYFSENPHRLLRDVSDVLTRYKHHGVRTNKTTLQDMRDQGKGIPTMLVIDTRGVQLTKGTDYDDHFRFYNAVPGENILGSISLEGKQSSNIDDVKEIAASLLTIMEEAIHVDK